jgi:hypothetical protein
MVVESLLSAPFVETPGLGNLRAWKDTAAERRWENEGGKLPQFPLPDGNESAPTRNEFSLELVRNATGAEAILYVYRHGDFARTLVGSYTSLRDYAGREYPRASLHEVYLAA